jgi:transcriptional regulator with XRE-family HTH domain
MGVQERAVDRGRRLGREVLLRIGIELRTARLDRGLTIDAVAAALGISGAQVSRIERGLAPGVALSTIVRLASVVGLDLVVRTYPGPSALRDSAQVPLLEDVRGRLHASVRWAVEVPLPIAGDQRAWDALIAGTGWRYGVEVESLPRDAQALVRRLHLKQRDGEVDGVLLVLPDTRRVRTFRRLAAVELDAAFPVSGPAALARLATGQDPGGSAVMLIPRPRRPAPTTRRCLHGR